MKRTIAAVTAAFAILLTASAVTVSAAAHTEETAYNWYCKHTSDHTQPPLEYLFGFTKKCDAYYADKSNTEYDADKKVIYLTFDAGYENGNVEKILDILKEENVPAAFFILENLVTRNTELVRRMAEDGHLVCNHTASHKDMTTLSETDFIGELDALNKACADAGIECSHYYRPPEGRFSEQNLKWASAAGYKTVFWSFAYVDWDNNAQPDTASAKKKVLDGTHNGEVILLHPTSRVNAEILGDLIKQWKSDGFSFGTLDELCS